MEPSKVRIFLVEDEHLVRELLEHALVENGFAVETAESGEEAIKMLDANSILVTKPFAPAQIVTAVAQLLNLGNTPGA
jgi:response regulator RpfG family c-di-GMP phosphodiesterase